MDKQAMLELWDEFNRNNTWFAGIFNAFEGLSPQQAAWKPEPKRHSIWQILSHICYWREVVVKRTMTQQQPPEDEIARLQWEEPIKPTDDAWRAARDRLTRSHKIVREIIESGALTWDKFKYMIPHDSYHVGQVTYLRAMQGMKAIE
jgi:uncharacterized damage-inducible protein DinB